MTDQQLAQAKKDRGPLIIAAALLLSVPLYFGIASLVGDEDKDDVLEARGTPPVVSAIRNLARLESVAFHMERIIEVSDEESRLYGLVKAKDSLLLVVAADVYAGVDLSKVGEDAITIEQAGDGKQGEVVYLRLPPPEILSVSLDEERTFVHSRDTDLLAERRTDLEQRARRKASETLRQAAIEAGIMSASEKNAAQTLTSLIRSLGYDDVRVSFTDQRR